LRRIRTWLAVVLLMLGPCLSSSWAQGGGPAVKGAKKPEPPPPALQYAVASIAAMLVLTILCYPTRKR
jgi:hypothetical protein